MNKLVFMNRFSTIDLEDINNSLRDRFAGHIPHDYLAEIDDNSLTVILKEGGQSVIISITDMGLIVESDDFFMTYEVAQILSDNYDEDPDMRGYFTTPADDDCDGDCANCQADIFRFF